MRCHKCNQDSIDIENGHILCDICGLDIDICLNLEEDPFLDLFFYNRNLEEAEKLGHEAMLGGKELRDNPYLVDSDQIILNKRWELGYNVERESYELSALSLSSEKIQNELMTQIKILEEERFNNQWKYDSFIPENYYKIIVFCNSLLKIKILGKFISKRVLTFKKDYTKYYKDNWKYPE